MGGSVPDFDSVGLIKANAQLAAVFQREVADLLGRNSTHFPGAQPVSFARKHLESLKHRDYWVCEKSDGVRCLLYFTCDGDREVHYFIDRKNDYYYVPEGAFHVPKAPPPNSKEDINWASFHVRTLLDGELLYDTMPDGQKVLKYLVFDALYMNGQDLTRRTLDKRLAYFMDMIYNPYRALIKTFPEDCQFIFQMEKKDHQLAYGSEMLFRDILPKLKHGNDGLIFTCRETPYVFGTDENILKWKPAIENTVDFRMCMDFPPLNLNGQATGMHVDNGSGVDYYAKPKIVLYIFTGDREGHAEVGELYIEDHQWQQMRRYAEDHNDGIEGAIVECHKDPEGRWRFGRFREDKTEANHVTVYHKVMESIQDAVSESQLIREAGEIKVAWKKRAADVAAREAEERRRLQLDMRRRQEDDHRMMAMRETKHQDSYP